MFSVNTSDFEVTYSDDPANRIKFVGWTFPVSMYFQDYREAEKFFNSVLERPETVAARFTFNVGYYHRVSDTKSVSGTLHHILIAGYHKDRDDTLEAYANPGHYFTDLSDHPGIVDAFYVDDVPIYAMRRDGFKRKRAERGESTINQ